MGSIYINIFVWAGWGVGVCPGLFFAFFGEFWTQESTGSSHGELMRYQELTLDPGLGPGLGGGVSVGAYHVHLTPTS